MGLGVTAFSKLTKLDALFDESGEPVNPQTRERYKDYFKAYVSADFPSQADGIEDRAVYSYEAYGRFWSASYGRYNSWRETLAKLAGYEAVPYETVPGYKPSEVMSHQVGAFEVNEGPFHELVCFSDCDGVIGPKVAAKLAKDFANWDERARALGDDWFYSKYQEWRQCFEMAADAGAVSFG